MKAGFGFLIILLFLQITAAGLNLEILPAQIPFENHTSIDSMEEQNYRKERIPKLSGKNRSSPSYFSNHFLQVNNSTTIIENQPNVVISNAQFVSEQIVIQNSPNVRLVNNTFSGNYSELSSVISLIDSDNVTLQNNQFTGIFVKSDATSQVFQDEFAILQLENSSYANLEGNEISNISSTNLNHILFGIHGVKSSYLSINANQMSNLNSQTIIGIYLREADYIELTSNVIHAFSATSSLHVETTGIYFNFMFHSIITKNQVFNFTSYSSEADSTNFGITVLEGVNITIQGNYIMRLSTDALEPEVTGIDAFQVRNVTITNNIVEDLYVFSPKQDEAFATGIYFALGLFLTVNDNRIHSVISDSTASYGIFADDTNYSTIENNDITSIIALSVIRPTTAGIGLRRTGDIIVRNNILDNFKAEIRETNERAQEFTATSVGISVDESTNIEVYDNFVSNLVSESVTHKPVDSIGGLIGLGNNVTFKHNSFENLTTVVSVDSFVTGILFIGSPLTSIIGNTLSNFNSISKSEGILSVDNHYSVIKDNMLMNFQTEDQIYGIYLLKNTQIEVERNEIINFSQSEELTGFLLEQSSDINIRNNTLDFQEPRIGHVFSFIVSDQLFLDHNRGQTISLWFTSDNSNYFFCGNNYHNGTAIPDNCPHSFADGHLNGIFAFLLSMLLIPAIILIIRKYRVT